MMCCVKICSRAAINNSLSRAAQRCPRSRFVSCPDRELPTLSADILTTGSCGQQPQAVGPVGLPSQGSGAEATAPLPAWLWSSRYLLPPPRAPLSAWIPPAGFPLLCLELSCRDRWNNPASAFVLGTWCELRPQQVGPFRRCHVLGKRQQVLWDQTGEPQLEQGRLESCPASCWQSPCCSPL